jgi:hypothetical protein
MQYEMVAETCRDLERATGRLQLIERLAAPSSATGVESDSGCGGLRPLWKAPLW